MRLFTRKVVLFILVLAILSVPVFARGSVESVDRPEITVGSKIDTEGALLGTMIVLVLEDGGFSVIDKTQTGSTPIVRSAIIAGEIDIYPEYTGNAYYFFSGETEADVWKDFQAGYKKAAQLDLAANGIVWLTPAPANNTWAISVRNDLARSASLETLDDLAAYVNAGGKFKLAASEEFVSSEAALPSFEAGYGFSLDDSQLLVFAGGNTTLTEQAAASGQENVNAAMAYGTDGQLAALGLKVLTDTRNIQPVYAPAPIVRSEVLEGNPEIATLLEPVFKSLDLETLQLLNSRIAVEGQSPREVADAYLKEKGFL
ncbi:MAG: ABC transporter substrate-binding protein [Spirochaetae bacterium HGW-Spirochaetae-4]|nr:MAG: osmoprotectant uptake system substrate-binding protein [Spirochaetes bacterium GWC2_52_13]PKL05739.1 MAG: ABC transporter substrate-binding protein [Spirochaetae bacterium HGW-Spirochaetae-9]PKL20036.1 MAG: ABC transporter substrate-binding protein [Spirochaetae bacterium HGW-Spirochaetae-4]HCG62288.1 ABC transporter substrate-binding protein [Sphaerochaeta sp.]HCS35417.1 ABC transporter substrate-binding protein [Sphaerochaeta sp.]